MKKILALLTLALFTINIKNKYPNENVKYYKVVEVELEIPFIPK